MRKTREAENSESEFPTAPMTRISKGEFKERAIIGSTITIRGEISGAEDLMIHGRVEGKIDLQKNDVTVASKGCVVADVYAKVIHIEGEVQGNLFGKERIVLCGSGVVCGDLKAPRVKLEAGVKFKGAIEMDTENGESTLKELPLEQVLSNEA